MEAARKRHRELRFTPMPDDPEVKRQHRMKIDEARRWKNNVREGLSVSSYMFQINHDHEQIRLYVRDVQNVRHIVLASVAMGCVECADIIIEHCVVPLSELIFTSQCVSNNLVASLTSQRKLLDYYVKRCNERTQLPFLLAFGHNSTQNTILKHSLYTRDVLRAILMLAAFKLPL
jgi:hypothetical protein